MASNDQLEGNVLDWNIPGSFTEDGMLYPAPPFNAEAIRNIKTGDVVDFDVLIATYPRSGTSWLVEICWLLLHDINIEKVKELNATDRYVFLEMSSQPSQLMQPPFVAETHVLFETARKLVEDKKKVIVGIRNPKDTLVSWYHFCRMNKVLGLFPGNWAQFMEFYKAKKLPYGDYFDNVLSWWNERHRENILVVFYEDLKHKAFSTIKTISSFLEKEYTDGDIQKVADWTTFSNIKNQPMSNYTNGRITAILKPEISPYMRKGTPGDWKKYFRDEDNDYIDEMCRTRAHPRGLAFKFE